MSFRFPMNGRRLQAICACNLSALGQSFRGERERLGGRPSKAAACGTKMQADQLATCMDGNRPGTGRRLSRSLGVGHANGNSLERPSGLAIRWYRRR
jgi:hypothetical protein